MVEWLELRRRFAADVLADDRAKFDDSGDQKYVEKARRRAKIGWDMGRRIEVIPHYRRPHLTLAWTGAGRSVPKIVPRRGSVVHREVVERVPSGREAVERNCRQERADAAWIAC